jgi:hypothetical protein
MGARLYTEPAGFTAEQFGTPASSFKTGPEFLTRAAVVIDLGVFVWGW